MEASWTEERITELKRLFELGLSCSQIAADLRYVTRCAVIGKLHRLGLRRENPQRSPRPRVKRESPSKRRFRPRVTVSDLPPVEEIDLTPPVCLNRVPLLEAKDVHCRWPAADDGSAEMVCGDPKFGPYAWCARHCRVAFIPREPRRSPETKFVPHRVSVTSTGKADAVVS